eukprot:1258509-Amphidinium_carterae.2
MTLLQDMALHEAGAAQQRLAARSACHCQRRSSARGARLDVGAQLGMLLCGPLEDLLTIIQEYTEYEDSDMAVLGTRQLQEHTMHFTGLDASSVWYLHRFHVRASEHAQRVLAGLIRVLAQTRKRYQSLGSQ